MRRLAGALLLALATPACAAPCAGSLCNADTLQPFFRKLAAARGSHERPVHILQIGDSHTAGDQITGTWRTLLQARYRSGGRGVMAPGRPYAGYLTRGINATMDGGWQVAGSFGAGWSAASHPPLGLAGFSLTSRMPGARIGLAADPSEAFDRLVLCGIAQPGAGSLTVRIGGEQRQWRFGSPTLRPECHEWRLAAPNLGVDVVATDDPVTITSWATFRDDGGVALSNLGVVGSQLVHFARTDDAVLAEELKSYRPDLIVVAFGTNEGFAPGFSAFSYEAGLRSQIGRLRRLAGNVPILLLGAPDAGSRNPALRANGPGDAIDCAATPAAPAPVTTAPIAMQVDPLADTVAALGGQAAREGFAPETPPPAAAPAAARASFVPPALGAVRASQRKIAGDLGVAFWDWGQRMGGPCTAAKWASMQPPLMRGDLVHYTTAGGREIANRLDADLEQAARGGR